MRSHGLHLVAVLVVVLGPVAGCNGDNLVQPTTGTLQVNTATTGDLPDPDGYTLQVDQRASQPIGTNATVQVTELASGDYTVLLGGLAANCLVSGANPVSVSVAAAGTTDVTFTIACPVSSPPVPAYETHDLGTLGGPVAVAYDINSAGQVVGWSLTGPSDILGQAFLWQSAALTALDSSSYLSTTAFRITSDGQVLGRGTLMAGGTVALLWNGTDLTELRGAGGEEIDPGDINDQGQVVGRMILSGPDEPLIGQAFARQNGVLTELGTLGGPNSFANANNNAGQIIGWSQTPAVENHLVMWQNGTVTDLGTLGGVLLFPAGINGAGQVIGSLWQTDPGPLRAFLWENGVVTKIGDWSGRSQSAAFDINESGTVVGYVTPGDCVDIDSGSCNRAFVWKDGVMTDLGTGFTGSAAYAINDAGVIVGTARVGAGTWHAMMWVPRQ